jgi:hypothetical protein
VVVSGLATYRVETCVKLDPARSQRCAYWTLWGNYDQEPVYAAVENHSPGARVIIPPRKDAVLSPRASTAPTQRDQHLLTIESEDRFAWKRTSGYYAQSHAENTFSRFKGTFGDRLRAKWDESQEREASLACQLLNRMLVISN